jgi:hypothetical protein
MTLHLIEAATFACVGAALALMALLIATNDRRD